jgi:hypothetical protein
MNAATKKFWQWQQIGYGTGFGRPLEGYAAARKQTPKATLVIGRIAGLDYGEWREGDKIPSRSVEGTVVGRRAEQVGVAHTGLTRIDARGVYQGGSEPSARVTLVWVKSSAEKTPQEFFRNMPKLAQRVASDLAQREVLIEWDAPMRRGRVDRASPLAAPSPASKKFCSWVREHSRSARQDPRDACYAKPRRKPRDRT